MADNLMKRMMYCLKAATQDEASLDRAIEDMRSLPSDETYNVAMVKHISRNDASGNSGLKPTPSEQSLGFEWPTNMNQALREVIVHCLEHCRSLPKALRESFEFDFDAEVGGDELTTRIELTQGKLRVRAVVPAAILSKHGIK